MDIPTKAIHSVADFSPCEQYRYSLVRDFASGEGSVNFIMLNPSTADETFNDPTVARCENRAIEYGFKQMVVTNVFAFRATDPKNMRAAADPVGRDKNDEAILHFAQQASLVICAWGEHASHLNRGQDVCHLLKSRSITPSILKLNRSGNPAHPLYLPKALKPSAWEY